MIVKSSPINRLQLQLLLLGRGHWLNQRQFSELLIFYSSFPTARTLDGFETKLNDIGEGWGCHCHNPLLTQDTILLLRCCFYFKMGGRRVAEKIIDTIKVWSQARKRTSKVCAHCVVALYLCNIQMKMKSEFFLVMFCGCVGYIKTLLLLGK